jgi:hypothetical protein
VTRGSGKREGIKTGGFFGIVSDLSGKNGKGCEKSDKR